MNTLDASSTLSRTSIPDLPLWRRGKVRDVYDLGDRLLIVTTDRISAFDVVLPTPIPAKGAVLTQLSLFWFRLCLLYTSPSPRDRQKSRMPSSA